MKKLLQLIAGAVLLCAFPVTLFSQIQESWHSTWGSEYWNEGQTLTIDQNNDIYVLGHTYFGSYNYDWYLTKFTTSGNIAWSREYSWQPGSNVDVPSFAHCDADGNIYAVGQSACSGTGCLVTVIKYNADGDTLWIKTEMSLSELLIFRVTTDLHGNFVIAGRRGMPSTGVVLKLDTQGNLLWEREIVSPVFSYCRLNDVVVDESDYIYAAGAIMNEGDYSDLLLVKYDNAGNLIWQRSWDGTNHYVDEAAAICTDHSGNLYIGGTTCIAQPYVADLLLMKYDTSGNLQWFRTYDGPNHSYDYVKDIATDVSGNVILSATISNTGFNNTDIQTMKHNPDGDLLWSKNFGGSGLDEPQQVLPDENENIFMAGYSYTPTGGFDGITVKYTAAGKEEWSVAFNGTGIYEDELYAIIMDKNNDLLTAGRSYSEDSSFQFLLIKYLNSTTGVEPVSSDESLPHVSAWPNPCLSSVFITYSIPGMGKVLLSVTDLTGAEIVHITEGEVGPGNHTITLNTEELPAGVYMCRMITNWGTMSCELMVIK